MPVAAGMSAIATSRQGRPFSVGRSCSHVSAAPSIASAARDRSSCLSAGPVCRQPSNASAAADTAVATSSGPAWVSVAHSLPVLGSIAAKLEPVETSAPPMTSGYGARPA